MLRVSRTYTHTYSLYLCHNTISSCMYIISFSLSLSLSLIFSHVSSSSSLSLSILSLTSVPPPSSHLPAVLPSHPCLPSYSFLKTFGPFPLLSPILPSLLLPLSPTLLRLLPISTTMESQCQKGLTQPGGGRHLLSQHFH